MDVAVPDELWGGTEYLAVAAQWESAFTGADAQELRRLGEEAFAEARTAHQRHRYRDAIRHLYVAVAANLRVGNVDDFLTATGNLAMQFQELGQFDVAIRLQTYVLEWKVRTGARPDQIVRSARILADAFCRTGDYTSALQFLFGARMGHPAPGLDDEMAVMRHRVELRRDLAGAQGAAPPDAPPWYAEALRHAGDAAHLELADALMRANMYADALDAARRAAAVARDPEHRLRALVLAGAAAAESGRLDDVRALMESAAPLLRDRVPDDTKQRGYLLRLLSMPDPAGALADLEEDLRRNPGAEMVNWIGRISGALERNGRPEQAMRVLEMAAHARQRAPQLWRELGKLHYFAGDAATAGALLDRSLALARELGASEDIALGEAARAELERHAGRPMSAFQAVQRAMEAAGESAETVHHSVMSAVGSILMTPGMLEYTAGETDEIVSAVTAPAGSIETERAIRSLRDQAAIARDAGDIDRLAVLLGAMANALERNEQFGEARRVYREALRTARASGHWLLYATVLHDFGVLMGRTGKLGTARRAFAAALAVKDRRLGGKNRHSSLLMYARVALLRGHRDEVERLLPDIERAPPHAPHERGEYFQAYAAVLLFLERYEDVVRVSTEGLAALNDVPLDTRLDILFVAADARYRTGRFDEAYALASRAHDLLDEQRVEIAEGQPTAATRSLVRVTHLLLHIAYELGESYAGEALNRLEHARSRSLLEKFGAMLPQPENMPPDLAERERAELVILRASRNLQPHSEHGRLLAGAIENARRELASIWASLPPELGAYAALRRGKPLPHASVLPHIPAHVICFGSMDDALYVWGFAPGVPDPWWVRLPVDESFLAHIVGTMREAVSMQSDVPEDVGEVASMLLQAVVEEVPPGERICFVVSGPLMQFPFAAVSIDGAFLIERNPFFLLPSMSVAGLWPLRARPDRRRGNALVVGDSAGDLPFARREAERVAVFLGAEAIVGADVTLARIGPQLRHADLLHVACHAVFNDDVPELSGFLAADRTYVTAREIARSESAARLAVLSACESARAAVDVGDEITGLAASLLYAGVPSVVSCLWLADDEATGDLMLAFYEELLGGTDVPSALRAAQLAVLRRERFAHPYYWAGMQAWGEAAVLFREGDR